MKKQILISFIIASALSCKEIDENALNKKPENIVNFDCVNKQADKSLKLVEVNKQIYGEWQLGSMITMLPSKEVPNIKIIFSYIPTSPNEKPTAEIIENGISKGKVYFQLMENTTNMITSVTVESENVSLPTDFYNFIKGNIRICEKELMIDNGMAFDAPAYLFSKTK